MRALIVDDHASVRAGISRALLEDPRFRIVTEARSAEEGIEASRASAYHVVLLDTRLPDADCIATVRSIVAGAPGMRILLLLENEDETILITALRSGARGAICKSDSVSEIVDAAAEIGRNGFYLSAGASEWLVRQLQAGGLHDLAPRELEVVRLVAMGLGNKQIATDLGVTEGTVKKFRARAIKKLGTRSGADLVRMAIEKGWVKGGSNRRSAATELGASGET